MNVANILAEKGRAVVTIGKSAMVSDAVDLLASKRIGAVVVTEKDGRICGIVSERDIVRELSRKGTGVLDQQVGTVMTGKVISCHEDDTIETVMAVMTDNRFRHVPIETDGKLSGIISIGDVVKRKIEQAIRDAEDLRNYIAMS